MHVIGFRQWDVFTGQALGGNPLGIFPEADGLDTEMMQALTREMNLSECTFICGGGNGHYKVRIFTPDREMVFAGHPVVGTAAFIFAELESSTATLELELMRDVVSVQHLERHGRQLVSFNSPPVTWHDPLEDPELAMRLTGLQAQQLETSLPVGMLDVGPTYCIVPVKDRAALEAASCDFSALRELYRLTGFDQLTVYCREPYAPEAQFSTRMFAPMHGVVEDPATGSSACCLAAYLRRTGQLVLPAGELHGLDQGYSMQRPARIWFSVEDQDGVESIRIAGEALEVASGEFRI